MKVKKGRKNKQIKKDGEMRAQHVQKERGMQKNERKSNKEKDNRKGERKQEKKLKILVKARHKEIQLRLEGC